MDEEKKAPLRFERSDEFVDRYANNVRFESSVWDLKVIFGTLDQSTSPHHIAAHTAINIPWLQAKLMSYFLQVNVLFQETFAEKIRVPENLKPEGVETFLPSDWQQNEKLKTLVDRVNQLREQL